MTDSDILIAVKRSLDNELDFGLDYEISETHEGTVLVIIVQLVLDEAEAWGNSWVCELEDLVMHIAWEMDAWYSWKGSRICLHFQENEG